MEEKQRQMEKSVEYHSSAKRAVGRSGGHAYESAIDDDVDEEYGDDGEDEIEGHMEGQFIFLYLTSLIVLLGNNLSLLNITTTEGYDIVPPSEDDSVPPSDDGDR